MSIFLIADVHLSHTNPKVVNGFLHFLNTQAMHAHALYILGDLFEAWLGDDDPSSLLPRIAKGLKTLKKNKVPCYFIHGNHDFLLSSKYANECGMILLPHQQIIKLSSGKNILILHGDILCTHDKSYILLRKIFKNNFLKKLFLKLPFFCRAHIAKITRIYCAQLNKYKSKKKLNVDKRLVTKMLIKNQSEIMIHGHIHKPTIHSIQYSKNIIFKRIVLGNWTDYTGSVVKINEKNNTIALIQLILNV